MRVLLGTMLAVSLMLLTSGCGKKTSSSATETPDPKAGFGLANLDGTYELTGMYIFGNWLQGEELAKDIPEAGRKFDIKGDTMTSPSFDGKKTSSQTFKTDPSKTPAEIDFTDKKKNEKDSLHYGIYKIEGDTLTIVQAGTKADGSPEARPKDFNPTKEQLSLKLKRK